MSIDFTKPLQSDGIPMRLLCTDAPGDYPVVCLNPYGVPFTFTLDGRTAKSQENHPCNLMNGPEQVTVDVWMNIYLPIHSAELPTSARGWEMPAFEHCLELWKLTKGFLHETKEGATKARTGSNAITLHIQRTVPVGHVDED